jgi:NADH-quinone oxidoreductase subunit J
MYTRYFYAFQACGIVLLIAMIGAIVLTLRSREGVRRQRSSQQINRQRNDTVEVVQVKIGEGV